MANVATVAPEASSSAFASASLSCGTRARAKPPTQVKRCRSHARRVRSHRVQLLPAAGRACAAGTRPASASSTDQAIDIVRGLTLFMSRSATLQPSRANLCAIPKPMPCAPPVTTTTRGRPAPALASDATAADAIPQRAREGDRCRRPLGQAGAAATRLGCRALPCCVLQLSRTRKAQLQRPCQ